ncbi:MAG: hybrid sensor histidine kinase/response regulator, partial [Trichloromonadaceae bacterium]
PELLDPLDYSLRKAGFDTFAAADGLNACRMVGSCQPELILLDIMLPDLDGWEVCRMIRSHPDGRIASIPIIMMTALATADHKFKGLELGADSYLPKPYSMKEVILQARNLVARRRQQERLREEVDRRQRGEELQSDLQNMIFHELRNHLLVIGGFSDVLKRDQASLDQNKSRGYLEAIQRSTNYLANLAEEFLMLRKVEAGTLALPRQLFDPAAIALEMSQLFDPVAADQGMQLQLLPPREEGTASFNATALRVVLANLLSNAIHFSPPDSTIGLSWGRDNQSRLYFEVRDAGPGIPLEEQSRIFERFYRGQGQERTRGSGLGLYIAKTLVAAMDGQIELSSEPGRGSCFRVILPALVDWSVETEALSKGARQLQ